MANHEQWMALCESGASIFATCSRRNYFSVVLHRSGRVLATGYNGVPSGLEHCQDGGCPRAAAGVAHGSSYGNCLAVHAEANALLHSDRSAREGGILYVNGPPCWECSKLIAGSGIETVVYKEDAAYAEWPKCEGLLESVGIRLVCIANSDKPRYAGSALGVGQEQPVDLACSSGYRSALDDPDRQLRALGYGPA